MAEPQRLEDLPATLRVDEVARLLRISRSAAYRAAGRGEIPVLRVGRSLRVPTARLVAMLTAEASEDVGGGAEARR